MTARRAFCPQMTQMTQIPDPLLGLLLFWAMCGPNLRNLRNLRMIMR